REEVKMKGYSKREHSLYFNICLLITSFVVMSLFLWSNELAGKLMFGVFTIINLITLFIGMLPGLILCLLFIFTLGSIILFLTLQNAEYGIFFNEFVSMQNFVIYGAGLLIAVLFAGFIHDQYSRIVNERNKLRLEIKQFIAVDPYTSFDNVQRMEIELQREINRINRYGGEFTLLFLELDHYFEFIKTYGYKEFEHLLSTIGLKINTLLRNSDRKFRYNESKFAFLLTSTKKIHVEPVVNKLNEQLSKHKLLNGKFVTLTFHMSFEE
ncbi:GGDEF domain-containing protein, partial [Butyricicoccus sp. 1XD8-22]